MPVVVRTKVLLDEKKHPMSPPASNPVCQVNPSAPASCLSTICWKGWLLLRFNQREMERFVSEPVQTAVPKSTYCVSALLKLIPPSIFPEAVAVAELFVPLFKFGLESATDKVEPSGNIAAKFCVHVERLRPSVVNAGSPYAT